MGETAWPRGTRRPGGSRLQSPPLSGCHVTSRLGRSVGPPPRPGLGDNNACLLGYSKKKKSARHCNLFRRRRCCTTPVRRRQRRETTREMPAPRAQRDFLCRRSHAHDDESGTTLGSLSTLNLSSRPLSRLCLPGPGGIGWHLRDGHLHLLLDECYRDGCM